MRRTILQLGLLSGVLAFALTLWLTITRYQADLLDAVIRAAVAGGAVIGCTLLITGIVVKLGGQAPDQRGQ